ncbi:unnamed protein product [Lepidochelys kempii]
MKEHFESSSHLRVINVLNESKKEPLTTVINKVTEKNIAIISKIFNIVYSLVKRNRPMSDMEDEVELQIKNETDLGNCLHSQFSAIRIVEHIGELIKQIFSKIIENNSKICIIIDEASTISSKTVLVILIKCELQDSSPTIFLNLVELESTKAENIYNALRNALTNTGFDTEYLKKNLTGFCSDGASTMLGHKSGVATKLIQDFPNVIIWHCLNHWLQLALDDAINDINEISHFKIFLDKIYAIFHQSNKSQFELKQVSEELYIEIIKIGRVFGPRWASCSLRAVKAVRRAYPALFLIFEKINIFSGMEKRLRNKEFLKDLALMIDILDEIALLSNALQARQLSLTKADKLIKRMIDFFIQLKDSFGIHENKINEMIASDAFKCIEFEDNVRFKSLPRDKIIECIIEKMKARLLNKNHIKYKEDNLGHSSNTPKIVELFSVIDPTSWNIEEVRLPWKSGEEKVHELNKFIKFVVDLNDFCDFVENNIQSKHLPDPETIRKAKQIMNTIAITSAEAESFFVDEYYL